MRDPSSLISLTDLCPGPWAINAGLASFNHLTIVEGRLSILPTYVICKSVNIA